MKKPNFFILGAPKCGTTSLAMWLSEHPNIFMCPIKEPHFFNVDGLRRIKSLKEYEKLFAKAGPEHLAVGEASTHYLYSKEAVPRILEYQPEAKFIVCIRNPIEMAPSLHAERVFNGVETVKDFEKAWKLQEERKKGKYIPRTIKKDPERLQYGAYCRLGEQLERLYKIVDKERVLVLVLDDIAQDPKREYQKVLSFLGVPYDGRNEFPVYNRRKIVRSVYLSYIIRTFSNISTNIKQIVGFNKEFKITSWMRHKLNKKFNKIETLSPEMKKELCNYFKDDIELLEKLLNRDFSHWLL